MIRIFAVAAVVGALAAQSPAGPPFAPAEALQTIRIEDGFRIGLFAHEPDTRSPVALDIDEDGRIFVVEMPGYPLDTSPTGRIRLLEDTNGDGRPDRSSIFADNLVLPSGVMRWKEGILVTAAPDLLYFEDTDGDRKADVRTVVLTGFAKTNPQHTVNSPLYGLDNWIHLAHEGASGAIIFTDRFGDRGSPLRFPDHPGAAALDPGSRSVRIRLDPPRAEQRAGRTQFGHAFDAWGRYFGADNSNHARHEVLAARHLQRNPDLVVPQTMQDLPDHGNAAEVFPITHNPRFELLSEAGQMTSACGLTLYLGGAWPARHEGSALIAEPVHNLVHRDVYVPQGPTFVAKRTLERQEFLASTDAWFRPVNFYVAPDGSLLLVDYYRRVIEHPEWTASDLHTDAPALYDGQDRGRLYRIVAEGGTLDAWPEPGRLRRAPDAELVGLLGHRNAWWRRTAQRLLVDRRSDAAVPLLEAAVRERPSSLARLHALWTLEGLGRLDPSLVALALGDAEPGVRENALQLAEAALPGPAAAREAVTKGILALERDPDPRVRLQLLATLGSADTPDARAAHERLLFAHLDDDWMQVAGLSASSDRAMALLQRALRRAGSGAEPGSRPLDILARETPGGVRLLERLASVVASRGRAGELDAVIHAVSSGGSDDAWWSAALLRGMARTLRAQAESRLALRARQPTLVSLAEAEAASVRRGALVLLRQAGFDERQDAGRPLLRAVTIAQSPAESADRRADALQLLRIAGAAPHASWLTKLIDPAQPEPVQRAAIEALGTVRGPDIGSVLLARWSTLTPPVRSAAADAMLADEARVQQLLGALRAGTVPSWSLDFWQKRRLLMNRNPAVRADSRALLEERPAERQAIVERYAAALNLQGDAARGREVFARACAACHRIDATGGGELGPDLATVRHKPLSALLTDILVPSKAIAQRYETYLVERVDGRQEVGVLAEETPTSVTLRHQGGDVVVSRQDIRRMSVVPQSSMPPDLDKVIDPREMADLLTFIARR